MLDLQRYARQATLTQFGEERQRKLLASSTAIVGCGALGTHIADGLVRAGVGHIRVIDRDFVELSNLQRQILFDEEDVASGLPKAAAAAEKLHKINSQVQIETVVTDVNPDNVEKLLGDVDLVLDGTDNFETRLLINDACLKHEIPWIYGGVISTYGMTMTILPHQGPCFRCLLSELPAPGTTPTCDTAGVLGTAAAVIAALEVTEGLKLLTGQREALRAELLYLDVWHGDMQRLKLTKGEKPCPACDEGRYEYLDAREGSWATSLCGRDAVQVSIRRETEIAFPQLSERLSPLGEIAYNEHMLRFRIDGYELNLFRDGRAIIVGCTDPAMARALYAKYVGL
jgi:adenylyltransferase/sulfurtransferase